MALGRKVWAFGVSMLAATPVVLLLISTFGEQPLLVSLSAASLVLVVCVLATGRRHYVREIAAERDLARRDALTGLLNRRGSEEALYSEHARVRRGAGAAGVLLVDLDRFHSINQAHDLAGGDLVLRAVSRRLREVLRGSDIVGRWGGEEFIVLAPNLDALALPVLAEKIRRAVRDTAVRIGSAEVTVTCSVGAVMLDSTVAESVSVRRANRALAEAKERRDAVCVASSQERRRSGARDLQVDALTGLLTWQSLFEFVLPREVERAFDRQTPLALLLVDLDQLKALNDLYGHQVGDEVIAGTADAIAAVVARDDLVFRVGGDQFAIVLPVSVQEACDCAATMLRAIRRRTFAQEVAPEVVAKITASIGIAVLPVQDVAYDGALATQSLLTAAEDAYLEAKLHRDAYIVKQLTVEDSGDSDVARLPTSSTDEHDAII